MRSGFRFRNRAAVLALAAVAVPLGAGVAHASPPSSQYKLVFGDEFSGTTLDTMKWNYNYPWGHTHNHAAYMEASQAQVGNGVLDLRAIAVRDPGAQDFYDPTFGEQVMDYTSGTVNTSGKFNATYGYFEARMQMPSATGSWPAFWMLQNGWPPEIDVMEFPHDGTNNTTTQYWENYHYTNASNNPASYGWHDNSPDLTAGYHTFGVEWTASTMTFYLDGAAKHTITDANAIADSAGMYMILDHAVGGWAGTAVKSNYPADFNIDWVHVWQKPPSAATTSDWQGTTATGSWDDAGKWTNETPVYQDQIARFGANANPSVAVTWNNSHVVGGLLFDTATAFNIGNNGGGLQLASSGGTATIALTAATTAAQTISSRVELYNNTAITNDSTQQLSIYGQIVGDGTLSFDGVGTVLVSNNNTYTGNTYIDTGTQGPAVVRADRSRAFGSTGTIVFNPGGNATTGRLELLANRQQPNPISLSGRNNSSVAIENVSDNNELAGTISATSGGGSYTIQSDAGLLTLSGAATGANGVALTLAATGTRTFTLQGAGNGAVTGLITNGTGTAAIAKAGGGTWTFAGNNTYTGATAVNAGTLLVNGSQAGGAYTVAAGAILGGTGTIDPTGTNAVTVAGQVAPGVGGIGTFTVGSAASPNNVVFSTGGGLVADVGAAGLADLLAVHGTLDLSSAGDALWLNGLTGAFDGSTYTIATFTPNTLGHNRFDALYLNNVPVTPGTDNLGNGYQVTYNDAAGTVQLVPVPEPATLALAGAAAMFMVTRRPRRTA